MRANGAGASEGREGEKEEAEGTVGAERFSRVGEVEEDVELKAPPGDRPEGDGEGSARETGQDSAQPTSVGKCPQTTHFCGEYFVDAGRFGRTNIWINPGERNALGGRVMAPFTKGQEGQRAWWGRGQGRAERAWRGCQ